MAETQRRRPVARGAPATALVLLAALAAVLAVGVAGLLLPSAARAADPAAVWVVAGGEKVFPSSPPGTAVAAGISAASGEYEAAQIVVRLPAAGDVSLSWGAGSDPLLTADAELFRVGYVRITQPSTRIGARRGWYPDPLLPLGFGQATAVPAGETTAFYLRLFVPPDTPAGDLAGTIEVTDPGGVTVVPVTLHVWDFGWVRPSLHTAFPLSVAKVMASVSVVVEDTPENQARLMDAYYRFFAAHWLSPTGLRPRPSVDRDTGSLDTTGLADSLGPYLGLPGVDDGIFPDSAYPLSGGFPWGKLDVDARRAELETYTRELFTFYRAQGWDRRAYVYAYDEPSLATEYKAEKLAQVVHAISAELGFAARVLLTDWPRSRPVGGRPANAFLFDDVDIWCPSIFRYFLVREAIDERHADGSEIWWYTYANWEQARYPTFLIDEPLTEERALTWMTWRYGSTGILYWGTTRWGDAITADGFRDPYANPVSYAYRNGWRANGEACLIYPGYYPPLGLTDPWAPPVSSLRLESLRDGIEDFEYLRLATRTRTGGEAAAEAAACAAAVAAAASEYPYGAHPQAYRNVPAYRRDAAFYDAARVRLASYIERSQEGLSPVVVSGAVVDSLSGAAVAAATVSDGVVSATTDATGAFTLRGVLPVATLTAAHPLYGAVRVEAREGDPPLRVALPRLATARQIQGFERRPAFRLPGSYTSTTDAWSLEGRYSARLVFRGGAPLATMRLPYGSRDLRTASRLKLDVFNPSTVDHSRQWFLRFTAVDRRGRAVSQRFLLRPEGVTHLSLPLRRPWFDRRHVVEVRLAVEQPAAHTVLVDALAAR